MFLLRHGQSFFNLHFNATRKDPGIEDPELTPHGVIQAAAAAAALGGKGFKHIIISPYTRALQTAQPFLANHAGRVQVMHEVRERAYFTCDIGTPPTRLAERFPQHDFAHLPERWWNDGIESEAATVARADRFRALMADHPDRDSTLLVSHWAFILALTGRSLANGEWVEYDPRAGAPPRIDWDT